MCYSALVEQRTKLLARGFKARVDEGAFLDLFTQRANSADALLKNEKDEIAKKSRITVAKNLEWDFLKDPMSQTEKGIKAEILRFWKLEEQRLNIEINKQTLRVKAGEASLNKKATKKAQDDIRIGTNKIKKANSDLEDLRREQTGESDSWIWPKYSFPAVYFDKELLVRPFRYLIRPNGQPPEFDTNYDGAYNAQQERLDEVFFWKMLFAKKQGLFRVFRFRERQDEDLLTTNKVKLVSPPKPRKEYEFNPGAPLNVPFIWDHWKDPDGNLPDLYGAAAITCDPPKAIQKEGIRRLLTPLKEKYIDKWLEANPAMLHDYRKMLTDYDWPELKFEKIA